jgi:hypothetical protein
MRSVRTPNSECLYEFSSTINLKENWSLLLVEEEFMRALQLGTAILVLVASVSLAIAAIAGERYFSAAAWILGCLAIEACIFDVSRPWEEDPWLFKGLAGGAAVLAIFSALFGSPASDSRRQGAQLDLVGFYTEVLGGIYEHANPAVHRVAERGMMLCAIQRYVDLRDLATELQMAQRLGPTPSLILGSYEQWLGSQKSAPTCIGSFVELSQVAPDLAGVFLRRHPEALTYK